MATQSSEPEYLLYYWPGIPGRGEFVRLAFEAAGTPYLDVARDREDGMAELSELLEGEGTATTPFAPPFLRHGELLIGQTAAILLYLGGRLGLAPQDEGGRLWAHQLQLTIADFVVEIHDTHHPIGSGLTYEEQKPESARRAADFRANRLPKFLDYFEAVIAANPASDTHLIGRDLTCPDLSLAYVIAGLRHAFPKAMKQAEGRHPALDRLHDAVTALPRIRAYRESDRSQDFSNGIFRHYPELDG